jgi:hypothetical protein
MVENRRIVHSMGSWVNGLATEKLEVYTIEAFNLSPQPARS